MSAPYSQSRPVPVGPAPASWACLRVAGADAETFLQGQLSGDVRVREPTWTSYNSPKGRMLAVLHLTREGPHFDLHMPASLIGTVAKRLRMFVLRSRVTIDALEPRERDESAVLHDRSALIEMGVPVVYPETQDRWVAQMANLDLIGGISFDKGCYTGQEVIARLHYLGNLKKRMFLVRGRGPAPLPGTDIRNAADDAQAVGNIVDAVAQGPGFIATAVLQLSVAESGQLRLDRMEYAVLARPHAFPYMAMP